MTVPYVKRTGGTADGPGRESLQPESFRTCNKSTYAVYLRAAFQALVESASKMPGTHGMGSGEAELNSWGRVLDLLNDLMASMKNTVNIRVLTDCLRYGRTILDLFIRLAIPMLNKQLEKPRELFRKRGSCTQSFQQVT